MTELLSRRGFLGLCGCCAALMMGADAAEAAGPPTKARPKRTPPPAPRILAFRNLHTEEVVQAQFMYRGKLQPKGLRTIRWVLRDHRSGKTHVIDPDLLNALYELKKRLRIKGPFEVVSAYRSPASNAMLADTTSGVANNSLHMKGQAIDIRVPSVPLSDLHQAACELKAGGVGFYPETGFVHVDTGRVRYW